MTRVNFNLLTVRDRLLSELPKSKSTMSLSGSSVHSLDNGLKAPYTESTCEQVLEAGGDTRSVGLSSELRRARVEVSF